MATKQEFTSFDDLLINAPTPVLVDFYAPWCGPCQLMASILEEVNRHMKEQIKIVKINVDNYPDLASQYQVQALPTLVVFKAGQPVQKIEGVVKSPQLIQQLQALI
jgi:thioredoxin